jgi:iron complex outermembrane receptor protein
VKHQLFGFLLATVSVHAFAQQARGPDQPTPAQAKAHTSATSATEEVVVTARRRSERLSKVPIAITVIGAQQLASRSIQSENDLQSAVPGLTIRQNGNANTFNYAIRGQSVDTFTNSPPGVLPYIDDAQIVTKSASSFYDLAGLQVLKGPQGTLFGRNATGGAVLYQTAKPSDQFSGYFDSRYGNYGALHEEGAINLPINNAIDFRLAGSITGGGAYVHNIPTNQYYGNLEQKSIRATLQLKPIDGLTNTTVMQFTHDGGTNTPNEAYSVYPCGATNHGIALDTTAACFYNPASPAFAAYVGAHPNVYQRGVSAFTALQNASGPWVSYVDYPLYHRAESKFLINTTTYEISPSLTIKNIFSVNKSTSNDGEDYDGTPYPIFQGGGTPTTNALSFNNPIGFGQSTSQISEELQLQGRTLEGKLNYVFGFYYLDESDQINSNLYAFGFSPIAPGEPISYDQSAKDRSLAGFAQATYRITDKLSLTGGVRYTSDQLSAQTLPNSSFAPFFGQVHEQTTNSEPSWTASADYRITPNLLAYVATRGSWRAGGYNYEVAPIDKPGGDGGNYFLPETTEDVEVGLKYAGRSMGVPITANADFFNQWINNVQRAAYVVGVGGSPTLLTSNVPAAQVTGFEADFTIHPADWLQLGVSGTAIDSRYTNGKLTVEGSTSNYGPYADSPKFSGNIFAELSQELSGDAGKLVLRADTYAQTELYFSNVGATLAPFTTIPGYALVNARLTWSNVLGSSVTAAMYVRNLLDKKFYAGGNAIGPSLGLNVVNPGQPRFFGGELRVDF